ncbi:hypothetical protein ACF08B_39575 [Streptomyces sp. NPDC015139]|uniref:hypothetical protein n=1 Tax=Streptomyces sp. NPDC015139 TaxID=3364942 RepID=UPI0036FD5FD2
MRRWSGESPRRTYGGEGRGTYGAALTFYDYHPDDVQRAATAIAEGRLDIPAVWRTDTRVGRRVEYWSTFLSRLTMLIYALAS